MLNFTNIDKILNLQISINAWRPLSEVHFGLKSQEI